jgi:hypothetical protein
LALLGRKMTICGYARSRSGIGFAWADSESYIRGRPIPGTTQKLVISPGAVVGVATGYRTLTEAFMSILVSLGQASFTNAIRSLPALLTRALEQDRAARYEPYENGATIITCAICGVDGGAFRGGVFRAGNRFEPVLRDAWTSPHVSHGVESAADVLKIAQSQIQIIKEVSPDATGKSLSIAKIGPEKVVMMSVPLLLAHEPGRAA